MRTALSTNQQHTFLRSLGKLLLAPRLQSILRIAVNFERKAVHSPRAGVGPACTRFFVFVYCVAFTAASAEKLLKCAAPKWGTLGRAQDRRSAARPNDVLDEGPFGPPTDYIE